MDTTGEWVGAFEPVTVDVLPGALAVAVLTRAAAAVAARTGLTLDRINDVGLIVESLAAHSAPYSRDGRVRVTLGERPGQITIQLGPLEAGTGRRVLADATVPGLGPVLERLADAIAVLAAEGTGEYLRITVAQPGE